MPEACLREKIDIGKTSTGKQLTRQRARDSAARASLICFILLCATSFCPNRRVLSFLHQFSLVSQAQGRFHVTYYTHQHRSISRRSACSDRLCEKQWLMEIRISRPNWLLISQSFSSEKGASTSFCILYPVRRSKLQRISVPTHSSAN